MTKMETAKQCEGCFGYLKAYSKARIEVNKSHPTPQGEKWQYDWTEFYPGGTEEVSVDMPTPKDKGVSMTIYVDADHAACNKTRRSVIGILVLVHSTPILGYRKR